MPPKVLSGGEAAGGFVSSQYPERVAIHTRLNSEESPEESAFIPEGQMELPFPMLPYPN